MTSTKNYRVKTSFTPRPNGHTEDAWQVGIDIGYSSVKIYSPNMVAQFPSFAEPNSNPEIGTVDPHHIRYTNLETGGQWIVGRSAQNSFTQGNTSYTDNSIYQRNRYDTEMFAVLVDVAIGLSASKNEFGDPKNLPIHIQTGLPSTYLDEDSKPLKKAFARRHHFSIKVGANEPVEYDITIKPEDISVMEQPMGTLMSVSFDTDHNPIPQADLYLSSKVLILDGGHGTFDTFEIANHQVSDKVTFNEFSMRKVLERTINAIYEKYDTRISPIAIQKCLETGKFVRNKDKFSSENIDFADILEEQSEQLFEEMINRIAGTNNLAEYDFIIITGGTGAAWADLIKEKLSGIEGLRFVDGNQNDITLPFDFANARGYYMFRYQADLANEA